MLDSRFWSKVEKTSTCWNWTASDRGEGYGCFWFNGKNHQSHRLSYENSKGKITSELEIDHLCRNRKCVNPEHLDAVTKRDNILRGIGIGAINSRKTHCIHGHEYTPENTYIRKNQKGRDCRQCNKLRSFIWRATNA